METVTDHIRTACARVCASAQHVSIDEDALARLATSLANNPLAAPGDLDEEAHYLNRGEDSLAFLVMLDAINFGSGWFPTLRKLPGRSGYFTVATHLARRFREQGPPSLDELRALNAAACARLFGQEGQGEEAMQLMALFARALAELADGIRERFDGSFSRLIESAEHRAERLVEIMATFPMWRDVQTHDGQDVPFFKRAQILSSDLNRAFPDHPWGRFDDLDRLTLFADNLVPHVLRMEGVLRYDAALAARIDNQECLEPGSPEEVEIRAAGVTAVEKLRDALATTDRPLRAMDLDNLLWERGQQAQFKAHPRHRCRGHFY